MLETQGENFQGCIEVHIYYMSGKSDIIIIIIFINIIYLVSLVPSNDSQEETQIGSKAK